MNTGVVAGFPSLGGALCSRRSTGTPSPTVRTGGDSGQELSVIGESTENGLRNRGGVKSESGGVVKGLESRLSILAVLNTGICSSTFAD